MWYRPSFSIPYYNTVQKPTLTEYYPYGILLGTCVLAWITRKTIVTIHRRARIFPRSFFEALIATWELSSVLSELNVVLERHGLAAFAGANFLYYLWSMKLCAWWDLTLPNGPLEGLILREDVGRKDCHYLLLGQAAGATIARFSVQFLWKYQLVPQHKTGPCQSRLLESVWLGMLIEGISVCVQRFTALSATFTLHYQRWKRRSAPYLVAMVTVLMRMVSANKTGGFSNGMVASGLTLGCGTTSYLHHFLVYWVSTLTGGYVAKWLCDNSILGLPWS